MSLPVLNRAGSVFVSILMLVLSNMLMTFAWYWHLRKNPTGANAGSDKPQLMIILMSWGIAFFEYCIAIPANRIGASAGLSLAQLKIAQEVITVCVFLPFMIFFMREQWRWDYLWALLCLVGAVYFVNRHAL